MKLWKKRKTMNESKPQDATLSLPSNFVIFTPKREFIRLNPG